MQAAINALAERVEIMHIALQEICTALPANTRANIASSIQLRVGERSDKIADPRHTSSVDSVLAPLLGALLSGRQF